MKKVNSHLCTKMYLFCIDLKYLVLFCEHRDSKLSQFRNMCTKDFNF